MASDRPRHVDAPNRPAGRIHDQGVGGDKSALDPHSIQHGTLGHAGRRKDGVLRHQLMQVVLALEVGDAGALGPGPLIVITEDQPPLELAADGLILSPRFSVTRRVYHSYATGRQVQKTSVSERVSQIDCATKAGKNRRAFRWALESWTGPPSRTVLSGEPRMAVPRGIEPLFSG